MIYELYQFICLSTALGVTLYLHKQCKKYNRFTHKLNEELSNSLEDSLYVESQKKYHYFMYNWYNSGKRDD